MINIILGIIVEVVMVAVILVVILVVVELGILIWAKMVGGILWWQVLLY